MKEYMKDLKELHKHIFTTEEVIKIKYFDIYI